MITIGYSTKTSKPDFPQILRDNCGLRDIQVIEKVNPGKWSLTEVYNQILDEAEHDIVILLHDDVYFDRKYWGKRVLDHFRKNPEYGILGVAGTRYMPTSGMWWEVGGEMIGQVHHQQGEKKWLSQYNEPFGDRIIETILVDGLFIAVNKNNIIHRFNEDVKGFHFYDVTFCIENYLAGVKIGTISNVEMTHLSVGMTNDRWEENKQQFTERFKDELPILLQTEYERPLRKKKKTEEPLVSVIMPVYNYGNRFEPAIQSVFASSYPNIELVVINDGSTNEYINKKIASLKGIPNITVVEQDNMRVAMARNNGVKASKGELILPLDPDDIVLPEYIGTCVQIIKNDPKMSPVYCDTIHAGEMQGVEARPEWSMERLLAGPFIVNCSMFHRKAFDEIGGYLPNKDIEGWEDYEMWVRMGKAGYVGKRIKKPLFMYFHHEKDGTLSSAVQHRLTDLYNRIMEMNGYPEMIRTK